MYVLRAATLAARSGSVSAPSTRCLRPSLTWPRRRCCTSWWRKRRTRTRKPWRSSMSCSSRYRRRPGWCASDECVLETYMPTVGMRSFVYINRNCSDISVIWEYVSFHWINPIVIWEYVSFHWINPIVIWEYVSFHWINPIVIWEYVSFHWINPIEFTFSLHMWSIYEIAEHEDKNELVFQCKGKYVTNDQYTKNESPVKLITYWIAPFLSRY